MKSWTKLDVDKPQTYPLWWGRARGWIIDGQPAVERLLKALEEWTHGPVNNLSAEQHLAQLAGLSPSWDPSSVSWELSNAIRLTSENSVVDVSSKVGDRHGFELYRYLCNRFKGVGPQQGQRVMEEILNGRKRGTVLEIRDALIEMDQKGRELSRYGSTFHISEPQWAMALENGCRTTCSRPCRTRC